MKNKDYNLTNLDVYNTLERGVSHRDFYGHLFRFSHALKKARIGMNILDVGCADGELCETFYRNRYKPNLYVGLDIRKKTLERARDTYKQLQWAQFIEIDLICQEMKSMVPDVEFDIITCYETAEHVSKHNVPKLLQNIKSCMSSKTVLLISTPCYDGKNAADNHTIDGKIAELTYDEMKKNLEDSGFKINDHFGVFASQSDYKDHLEDWIGLKSVYDRLKKYYDSNVLSILLAPLFPKYSRNVLWDCSI